MEDRITSALYLEMTNRASAEYVRERVDLVLARPGAERATWWANERPGREGFPRTIPEFTLLGLYEVTTDFERPDRPEDIGGLLFRHYPRPAQGNLNGKSTLGLELILLSPKDPEQAQTLRDWCDFIHLHHIAAAGIDGFTMITPYENSEARGPRFMHVYEMDTLEAEATFRRMTPTTQRRRVGERGSALFEEWFLHPQAALDYVNTFRRLGERWA